MKEKSILHWPVGKVWADFISEIACQTYFWLSFQLNKMAIDSTGVINDKIFGRDSIKWTLALESVPCHLVNRIKLNQQAKINSHTLWENCWNMDNPAQIQDLP